jgi:hypothetical protein
MQFPYYAFLRASERARVEAAFRAILCTLSLATVYGESELIMHGNAMHVKLAEEEGVIFSYGSLSE